MKIIVVGPGALGCLFAAFLGRTHDVWLLDHDPVRARKINEQGLILDRDDGRTVTVKVNAVTDVLTLPSVELVFLCVKSSSVKSALTAVMPLLDKDRPLLIAFQNGIGHFDVLRELSPCAWAVGVTAQGATLAGPGKVMHRGMGPTTVGFMSSFSSDKDRLIKAAQGMSESGIPTETTTSIEFHVWNKLLINVGINALTAINDCPNGMLLESESVLQTMKEAILEGEAVAKACGIEIAPDPVGRAIEVCRATAKNVSSMLQDVRRKRRTEIDTINGALVRKGREVGIPVPVNEELVRKVREIEKVFH